MTATEESEFKFHVVDYADGFSRIMILKTPTDEYSKYLSVVGLATECTAHDWDVGATHRKDVRVLTSDVERVIDIYKANVAKRRDGRTVLAKRTLT